VALTVLVVLAGGFAFKVLESPHAPQAPATTPAPHADETKRLFDAAVVMLHARRHEEAAAALHRVLRYAPQMPEAHVNMGFAMLGLQRLPEARDFFEGASALAPQQANAYYGLALVHEARGDLPMARGAMRTYLHLARDERPEHLARARAALWEWEQPASAAASAPR
jgi:tetratricopeptide (TPR) repeat protein